MDSSDAAILEGRKQQVIFQAARVVSLWSWTQQKKSSPEPVFFSLLEFLSAPHTYSLLVFSLGIGV